MTSDPDGLGPDSPGIRVSSYQMHPDTLITARSYLIDRAVPDCEIITLPGREVPGGVIPYRRVDRLPQPSRPGRLRDRLRARLRGRGRTRPVPLQGRLGMDCRIISPENWSHFLNIHAPLAIELARRLEIPSRDLTLILPAALPGYIRQAADHLGLPVQLTDAPVEGPGVLYRLSDNIIRPDRRDWLMAAGLIERQARLSTQGLPRQVFLARRKTRNLSNQAQIEELLGARGFVTIYPEDLPVVQQFALFNAAETIVAVHGAGLAPLLYRHPDSPLRRLVEILPAGHMTDMFRMMAQQVGCEWIGVRGRLKPEYITPAYDLGRMFTAFSQDSFEADPVALERALDHLASR